MASMRDAIRRLQIIYEACAPEAVEAKEVEKGLDEFTRIRKKLHVDVKAVRLALKEREALISMHGTTTETAEASYRIRVQIRSLKEEVKRMADIVAKEERKKKIKDPQQLADRKEVLELCNKHIEECEALEKHKFNEEYAADRKELLSRPAGGDLRNRKGTGGGGEGAADDDPFTKSELPDIDVQEDLKKIEERNKNIDNELEQISIGVGKLKDLANTMGEELSKQNEMINEIDANVENVLDHLDSVNLKMKKAVDKNLTFDIKKSRAKIMASYSFSESPTVATNSILNIDSTWRQSKPTRESYSQSDPILKKNGLSQTITSTEIQTQTDNIAEQIPSQPKYNVNTLTDFLKRVENQISNELLQNLRSSAFEGKPVAYFDKYSTISFPQGYTVEWEDEITTVRTVLSLHKPDDSLESMSCTEITWNANGSILAAGYGRIDHENWCAHKGYICAWYTNRNGEDENREKPFCKIEVPVSESCCVSVAFHPESPAIAAVGLFSGELVIVFVDDKEDTILASSKMDNNPHQEPITKLFWVPGKKKGQYMIITCGSDGKIILWDPANKLELPISMQVKPAWIEIN
ncbi:WD repeat-containing protein 34 [Nowakowskiella sp. JEL0407]|nr:WD repeat-containing protein 34 [Nowakowskiella sp. JEL0407]